jgi:hypothetical protein
MSAQATFSYTAGATAELTAVREDEPLLRSRLDASRTPADITFLRSYNLDGKTLLEPSGGTPMNDGLGGG